MSNIDFFCQPEQISDLKLQFHEIDKNILGRQIQLLTSYNEKEMIEGRSGVMLMKDDEICQFHRNLYGRRWTPLKMCYFAFVCDLGNFFKPENIIHAIS